MQEHNASVSLQITEDVQTLLRQRIVVPVFDPKSPLASAHYPNCILALSDLHRLLSSIKPAPKAALHKLLFYLSLMNSLPAQQSTLSKALRQLDRYATSIRNTAPPKVTAADRSDLLVAEETKLPSRARQTVQIEEIG